MTNINISHVLLVGACVRPAAESAHAAGYTVTAIDLFGDSDTRKVAAKGKHFQITRMASITWYVNTIRMRFALLVP